MASPFRVFRKYQKTLLVVAGVVLMFVFVVGDSLSTILRGLGGPSGRPNAMEAGAVAVKWDGGKLTNRELEALKMRRRVVNDFLRGIEMQGRYAAMNAGAEPQPLRVVPLVGPETPQQGVEQDVVRMQLFAEIARRAGMSVSDENIVRYLMELGRGRVSADQIRQMVARLQSSGRGASLEYLFAALREEMLASNYLASYKFALATVMPEQRWQDWLRANDRVVVEAAALPVSSFLVDVPEPTDAELTEFFDQYKNDELRPDFKTNTELPSARPGFAIPRKIDIRYVRANFDQELAKLKSEVTDQEIQEYYDANKEYFIRADSGMNSESGTADEGTSGDAAAPASDQSSPDATTEAPPAEAQPVPPAEGQPADTTTPAGSGDAAPATEDSSRLEPPSRPGPFRLTALAQAADAPAEGDAATAESTAASEESTAATDAVAAPASAAPSASDATDASSAAAGTADAAAAQPVEYQPLDEVRDEIRLHLASQKVQEHLVDLMARLKIKLNAEFSDYFGEMLSAKDADQETPAPPAALVDLSALAKANDLEYGETGPVSALQLRELPIGKSFDVDTNEPLLQLVFSTALDLYQPVTTFDVDNNRYLAMKVSDTPRRVPELSEVRDEVVRAWKLQQAAELAEKHAQELAAKIEESGSTLVDYFVDDSSISVERTDPFAWLTIGDVSQSGLVTFRLSEPTGIVAAGPDFMSTVFELGDDQVGAVLNNDHTIAYLVRVAEHQNTREGMRQTFLAEADQWYGLPTMAQLHMRNAAMELGQSIREEAKIDWVRPPDQIVDRDEE